MRSRQFLGEESRSCRLQDLSSQNTFLYPPARLISSPQALPPRSQCRRPHPSLLSCDQRQDEQRRQQFEPWPPPLSSRHHVYKPTRSLPLHLPANTFRQVADSRLPVTIYWVASPSHQAPLPHTFNGPPFLQTPLFASCLSRQHGLSNAWESLVVYWSLGLPF